MAAALGAVGALGGTGLAFGAFGGQAVNRSNSFSAAADFTAPSVPASVVGKATGGIPGFIRQGGSYHVYASVSDAGNPASGVASVAGDLGAVTTGQGAVALAAGTFTVGGVAYNRRSAALTANATLAAGARAYAVTATDAAANARTTSFSVTVDNTAPAGADVQTSNGGVAGRADAGDRITLTNTEPLEPISVLAGWTGAATNVVVRITNNGNNDELTVRTAANTAQLPLGVVSLGGNYVMVTTDFGAALTPSSMVVSGNAVQVTLGTAATVAGLVTGGTTMSWTPTATVTDRAGNAGVTTAVAETGASDVEF